MPPQELQCEMPRMSALNTHNNIVVSDDRRFEDPDAHDHRRDPLDEVRGDEEYHASEEDRGEKMSGDRFDGCD